MYSQVKLCSNNWSSDEETEKTPIKKKTFDWEKYKVSYFFRTEN